MNTKHVMPLNTFECFSIGVSGVVYLQRHIEGRTSMFWYILYTDSDTQVLRPAMVPCDGADNNL